MGVEQEQRCSRRRKRKVIVKANPRVLFKQISGRGVKLWGEADLEGRKNDLFFGHDTCEVIGNILDFFICKGGIITVLLGLLGDEMR